MKESVRLLVEKVNLYIYNALFAPIEKRVAGNTSPIGCQRSRFPLHRSSSCRCGRVIDRSGVQLSQNSVSMNEVYKKKIYIILFLTKNHSL